GDRVVELQRQTGPAQLAPPTVQEKTPGADGRDELLRVAVRRPIGKLLDPFQQRALLRRLRATSARHAEQFQTQRAEKARRIPAPERENQLPRREARRIYGVREPERHTHRVTRVDSRGVDRSHLFGRALADPLPDDPEPD